MYLKKLKIGNIELENNILLAPMAGITDLPFRLLCEKYNPGLVCTEMISAKGLFYDDSKTKQLLKMDGEKRPIAVQIFGSDIDSLVYSAKYVKKYADIIDINMGCPAPKVVKNGDGSKLLLDLDKVYNIVKAVVDAAQDTPVTVKIRKGWDENHIVAVEAAKLIEKAGAKAITIHGRTTKQYYSGSCDLDIIKEVKKAVKIPVIGNGDIKSKEDALKMFEYTNVDAIMIGRATFGNPMIIKEIQDYLSGKEEIKKYEDIINEKFNCLKLQLDLEIQEKGEERAIREMRKHICYYLKGLPKSSEIRQKVIIVDTKQEVLKILDEYLEYLLTNKE